MWAVDLRFIPCFPFLLYNYSLVLRLQNQGSSNQCGNVLYARLRCNLSWILSACMVTVLVSTISRQNLAPADGAAGLKFARDGGQSIGGGCEFRSQPQQPYMLYVVQSGSFCHRGQEGLVYLNSKFVILSLVREFVVCTTLRGQSHSVGHRGCSGLWM